MPADSYAKRVPTTDHRLLTTKPIAQSMLIDAKAKRAPTTDYRPPTTFSHLTLSIFDDTLE